ncbi:TetR family transcriptional regulator [Streptomyces sp. SLBN-118]|uniref:TetR/AcrR family transcriptional regulator n=1 Tax=Streptomyces sp. SLBN-118 TaxID=2768454 RepID=UPI00114E3AC2|nr:TetR/AcrR family transcriptional regulator [Streptomyces sp. SLBN-118]TQK44688.1 TetR family transcriptional regulator [Streptomyces sp. SLBN-118]
MPEPTTPEPAATARRAGTTTAEDAPAAKPRRRQARGERRIAQLLDAAASVFCASGYTAASTNAIAREAGVSPGTLYQFFPNKEAIAVELGGRLLERWRESHGAALTAANLDLPLDQLLDAVLDPLFAFNHENPAFAVLVHGPDVPGQITQEFEALHAVLLTRIEEIIASFVPDAPPAELSRIATMTFAVFKAGLDLVLAHEGEERQAYIDEIKKVMFGYLAPMVGLCPAGQRAPKQQGADAAPHSHNTP